MKRTIISLLILISCSTQRDDLERSAYVGFDEMATTIDNYLAANDATSEARAIAIQVTEKLGQDATKFRAIPVLTDLQVEALRLKSKAFHRLVAERLAGEK